MAFYATLDCEHERKTARLAAPGESIFCLHCQAPHKVTAVDERFVDQASGRRRPAVRRHDPEAATAAREGAIAQVDANAAQRWKTAALQAIQHVARALDEFTADEVWFRLTEAHPGLEPHEPAALGPVFMRARSNGWIKPTNRVRRSTQAQRHRNLTVWESCLR